MNKVLIKALILLFLLTIACNKKVENIDPTSYSGEVVIYTSIEERYIKALKDAFENEYPNVKLDYYSANIDKINSRLQTEIEAHRLDADVIWAGTQIDAYRYKELGYLEKYVSKENRYIPKNLVDKDGYFAAARVAIVGFGYNEKGPNNWKVLFDEKYKNKIAITDPEKASIYKFFIACMMQNKKYGKNYFKKLKENGLVIVNSASEVITQLEDKKIDIGLVIDQAMKDFVIDDENVVNFKYSNSDVYAMSTAIGLAKEPYNPENAKLLIDFILSKKGQEVLSNAGLLSVRKDMKNDYHTEKAIKLVKKIDLKDMSENYDKYIEEFNEIMKGKE